MICERDCLCPLESIYLKKKKQEKYTTCTSSIRNSFGLNFKEPGGRDMPLKCVCTQVKILKYFPLYPSSQLSRNPLRAAESEHMFLRLLLAANRGLPCKNRQASLDFLRSTVRPVSSISHAVLQYVERKEILRETIHQSFLTFA